MDSQVRQVVSMPGRGRNIWSMYKSFTHDIINPLTPVPGIYQVYGYRSLKFLGKTMSHQIDPLSYTQ
jgi:hypothetical protein